MWPNKINIALSFSRQVWFQDTRFSDICQEFLRFYEKKNIYLYIHFHSQCKCAHFFQCVETGKLEKLHKVNSYFNIIPNNIPKCTTTLLTVNS